MHARGKADFGELAGAPLGGLAAGRVVGRVGRDARNAQQLEKPIQRRVRRIVEMREHRVESLAHIVSVPLPFLTRTVTGCASGMPQSGRLPSARTWLIRLAKPADAPLRPRIAGFALAFPPSGKSWLSCSSTLHGCDQPRRIYAGSGLRSGIVIRLNCRGGGRSRAVPNEPQRFKYSDARKCRRACRRFSSAYGAMAWCFPAMPTWRMIWCRPPACAPWRNATSSSQARRSPAGPTPY